ncbi:MAG: HAD family hydrolase [Bacteroidetes bacterium]|nr:MAG: HAD family hydrolase [Bacteroidota bacterium]
MKKALFLDRDGIINVDKGYVHTPACFEFMPAIVELCQHALSKGYELVLVTNQSGIARGMFTAREVDALHSWMSQQFKKEDVYFAGIYYCPHHPAYTGPCSCRKPATGMFELALRNFGYVPAHCWMLGDRERDLIPAKQLGMKTAILGKKASPFSDIRIRNLTEMKAYL